MNLALNSMAQLVGAKGGMYKDKIIINGRYTNTQLQV